MKKLYIKTYGCQMNVYDSARMADLLAPLGYAPVEAADDADMVILNTCHIREKATEKVYSELGQLKLLKAARAEAGSPMLLAVAGCVAQAEGKEIIARQPAVDVVVGPQSYHRLPEMIAQGRARGERRARNRFSRRGQVRSSARRTGGARPGGVPHRAGRLRQVLHVLRRALYARRGVLAPRRADRRGSAAPGQARARARSRSSART